MSKVRVALPAGAYLLIESGGGAVTRTSLRDCASVEGARVGVLDEEGSVSFALVTGCRKSEEALVEVRGRAFATLAAGRGGIVLVDEEAAATPAPVGLSKVKRFEHHHLAHVLGFALARSGGSSIERAWAQYPGDAVRHAPIGLLSKIGGVEEALWAIALGGQADIEEFVSGLILGMGNSGIKVKLDEGALLAFTFILRRGGIRHVIDGGAVAIESVMDALLPRREAGGVWVEPINFGGSTGGEVAELEVEGRHPLIVGYIGWYLAG